MRGSKALYHDVFPSSVKRPKRTALLAKRDTAMTHRYYYYAQLQRLRYDDCLMRLSEEFFITPDVIVQRLQGMHELLRVLIASRMSVADLRKAYPHFSW
jgi:hypothetical protein